MSKVSAETPSNAQQKVVGTDSTNAAGGGAATAIGAVRMTPASAALEGWMLPSLTVDFIGESGVTAMRPVSLRGPAVTLGLGVSRGGRGTPSFGAVKFVSGADRAAGAVGVETLWVGVIGERAGANGGRGAAGCKPAGGKGGALGGRIAPVGVGAGGVEAVGRVADGEGEVRNGGDAGCGAIGAAGGDGRADEVGLAGGGTDAVGGTRTGGETGAGGRATGAAGGRRNGAPPGGRFGKLIRTVSLLAAAGLGGLRGGNTIRTVSFWGSFTPAIELT